MFNGIHLRVFECIGSGVLPVPEWTNDLDTFFNKMVPSIKNYHEADEIARYYLEHEPERLELIGKLQKHLTNNYLPGHFVGRMKSILNL
ncbi:MAG: glycosyltransferase [Bacteroidetes bacterium]|nr:glycosyltransferase [Bacteroidota bacterium]